MKSSNYTTNERGLTLVEILAALVILGIVFVGFMAVFPQMTNFNEKTETKLETMNLAKVELVSIKKTLPNKFYEEKASKFDGKKGSDIPKYWTYIYPLNYEGFSYSVEVDYYYDADLKPVSGNTSENQVYLFKVHVRIFKDTKLSSETFGYIETKKGAL